MQESVTRKDFIRKFMDVGFGYVEAVRAFDAMTEVFGTAVCCGHKICVGRVLSLNPTIRPPRVVNMRFSRDETGVKPAHKQFYLGRRLAYRVNIYREFTKTRQLQWT